ncbi:MAG: CotH kinase family protein, partial [Flavobacteriales bacterium]
EKGIFVPGTNFDPEQADWTGNYYQYGREWERSAHVEYFKDSKLNYSSSIGLRTHGGNSRRNPQKGMRLYARTEYGNQKFRQSFFGQNGPAEFKRLVLKPMSSAWTYAGMQDMLCNRMTENPELNIHGVNSSPAAVYINGIYWGLYQLQEHVDRHFISTHYQLDEDEYDLIKDWYGEADIGNNEAWSDLYDFIEENDLSDPINYSYVESQIDLGNFIDYQIFQTFVANRDWPANNMICWKGYDHDQKWRWVFKDGDAAMLQLDLNYLSHSLSTSDVFWPTNATSTLFLRKLLANQICEDRFYHRFTQLVNGIWKYEELRELFNEGVTKFHDEVVAQNIRFSFLANYSQWLTTIDKLNYFLQNRACELDLQLKSELNRSINPPSCILSETEVSQVEVFPNPNMSQFTFSFYSTHSKNIAVNVRNFHGRIIHTMPFPAVSGFNSVELNHLNLPAGVYLIEVEADFSKAIAKMIVI